MFGNAFQLTDFKELAPEFQLAWMESTWQLIAFVSKNPDHDFKQTSRDVVSETIRIMKEISKKRLGVNDCKNK